MNEQIEELIRLSKENPHLEIKPVVNYEIVDEDSLNWLGNINKIEKDFIYILYDRWICGYDDIIENIVEHLNCDENLSYDEIEEIAKKEFEEKLKSDQIKEAILIYIIA